MTITSVPTRSVESRRNSLPCNSTSPLTRRPRVLRGDEGRAQFMADRRQEARLGQIGAFGAAARLVRVELGLLEFGDERVLFRLKRHVLRRAGTHVKDGAARHPPASDHRRDDRRQMGRPRGRGQGVVAGPNAGREAALGGGHRAGQQDGPFGLGDAQQG
jgi:hypothetical protein